MTSFINLAGYQFTPLDELEELQQELKSLCLELEIKGTILLAQEGINFFVAGRRHAVDQLLARLREIRGLENLKVKESESSEQPFRRMFVKIKKEIISFGIDGIDPAHAPSPKITPTALKEWLDAGEPIALLDTRNDYEVKMGTFKGAIPAGINHFRDLPQAVKKLPEQLKEEPLVIFCTGGIRCEKAGPFLEQQGFKNIFQLEGGILDYFKECGGAHYQGECFVFDRRVGLNTDLKETASAMCFACQMPLTLEDQRHPHYKIEESCPHCFAREKKEKPPQRRNKRKKLPTNETSDERSSIPSL
jgi:UPF0176 protein